MGIFRPIGLSGDRTPYHLSECCPSTMHTLDYASRLVWKGSNADRNFVHTKTSLMSFFLLVSAFYFPGIQVISRPSRRPVRAN